MSHNEASYQLYTSFDRSAALDDSMSKFITLEKENTLADAKQAFDMILTNPSCNDNYGC